MEFELRTWVPKTVLGGRTNNGKIPAAVRVKSVTCEIARTKHAK